MDNEILKKIHEEAESRYSGPRMFVGTITDREINAFAEGAYWMLENLGEQS